MIAELAIMRLLYAHKGEKAVYIGPLKSLVCLVSPLVMLKRFVSDWKTGRTNLERRWESMGFLLPSRV